MPPFYNGQKVLITTKKTIENFSITTEKGNQNFWLLQDW
jgi:hypothetical protein